MAQERQENTEISPWWGEHVHRYIIASEEIKENSTILDIACGTGFGAFHLSKIKGSRVYGIDLSEEAITECSNLYKNSNLHFKVGDATKLPFENEHFDYITSFETIEHSTEYSKILSEFNRILKKGGVLFLSTPNIKVNSPTGIVTNPYHTQEFTYQEVQEIIEKEFSNFSFGGQKYTRYKKQNIIASIFEKIFYLRGFRKTPIKLLDWIMNKLIGKTFYPEITDFEIVYSNRMEVENCKTFFIKCMKS
ncbi:MAG: class I SAM-dependent methyltransferase [Bacteroidetes bacterium]|nr:class I SAM-dependent methyltransferase [Bacteroidota bacterium]